jgi:hypothetical protein
MAGTMATNAHHVASGNVPVGLITGMVALIDAAEKDANTACTNRLSRFCWFIAVFSAVQNFLHKENFYRVNLLMKQSTANE